jgi:hypothetical protein
MTPASEIVSQQHIARVEDALGPITQPYFGLPFQGNHVLASGSDVEVLKIATGSAPELNTSGTLHCGPLCISYLLVRKFQLFKMGLAIFTSVNPDYLHLLSSIRYSRLMALYREFSSGIIATGFYYVNQNNEGP